MRWIALSERDTATATLEKRLWDAVDQFRANSGLKSQEYSAPVLGLIFLRFAEVRFAAQRAKLEKAEASSRRGSRVDEPAAYHAEGTFRRMQVLKPSREVIARFAGQADAMFEQVNTLQRQIQNLCQTHDLLLPRLLSGQVELKVN